MAGLSLLQSQQKKEAEKRQLAARAAQGEFNNSPMPVSQDSGLMNVAGAAAGAMGGMGGGADAPGSADSALKGIGVTEGGGKNISDADLLGPKTKMFDEQGNAKKEDPNDFLNGLMSYTRGGGY